MYLLYILQLYWVNVSHQKQKLMGNKQEFILRCLPMNITSLKENITTKWQNHLSIHENHLGENKRGRARENELE